MKQRLILLACLLAALAYPVAAAWPGRAGGEKVKHLTQRQPAATRPAQPENGQAAAAKKPSARTAKTRPRKVRGYERAYLLLVNKQRPLPTDSVPSDLRPARIPFAGGADARKRSLREEAAAAVERLFTRATADGVELLGVSAFRSYQRQQAIFAAKAASVGETAANRVSAKPGQSEHQSGLAIDVSSGEVNGALSEAFADTEAGLWLAANARTCGFIIRYPRGKEMITGYQYEPWHLRYVGVKAAGEIAAKGLTLEEYLGKTAAENPQNQN